MDNINVPSYNSLALLETRKRAIQDLYDYINRWKPEVDGVEEIVEDVIPEEASEENQLADKNYVNEAVATNSAEYKGSYNLVSDLSLTTAATRSDIQTALGTAISDAGNNDTAYVQIPIADATPTKIDHEERYKFNGTSWEYEYSTNASPLEGVFDISVYNNNAPYADLSAALGVDGVNVPSSVRRGGMSVKYVCTSDNKYVQYRLMATSFSTTPSDWQGIDDEPTADSNNLVKSGGVFDAVTNAVNSERERAELAEQNLQDNIDNIKDETLQENRQMVNSIMENYAPVEITGDVNNAADEEDLTSVSVEGTDVLKFKDKAYNPLVYSGLGRKILRKNIVDGVNILTQDMMPIATEEGQEDPGRNTIYVIQYDYDLNNNEITVPENCVLEFDGGSLSNGTVHFNYTLLTGNVKILTNVYGTIKNDKIDITYFGCDSTGNTDCSSIIRRILSLGTSLYIPDGTFLIEEQIEIPMVFSLYGNGSSSILKCTYQGYAFYYPPQVDNKYLRIRIDNICVQGTYPSFYSSIPTEDITDESCFFKTDYYTYECSISNCIFTNLKNAFYIHMGFYAKVHQNSFLHNYDAFIITEGNASSFTNNNFNFIFHVGITFKGRGDGVNEENLGVNIAGNSFQTSGFTGIWILSKYFQRCAILGNYFEKQKRESAENPNNEIIVGDVDGSQNLGYKPSVSGCIIEGNSGLWAPKGIYLNECDISGNRIGGNIILGTNVTGKNNYGSLSEHNALYMYRDGDILGTHYRQGRNPIDIETDANNIIEKDVLVLANSTIELTHFSANNIKFLSYMASVPNVSLIMKTNDATPTYIAGGVDDQDNEYGVVRSDLIRNVWESDNLPVILTTATGGKRVNVILKNTSNQNICVDVNIKYCSILNV